jgi:hypothetical protein
MLSSVTRYPGGLAASPVTGWVAPAAATLMAPTIGMVNTTAVARVMTLDWAFFAKQR